MADTTYTGFRSTDGVLATLNADGGNLVIENDGKSYYSYGTAGALSTISIDATAPTLVSASTLYSMVGNNVMDVVFAVGAAGLASAEITAPVGATVTDVTVISPTTVRFNLVSAEIGPLTFGIQVTDLAGNVSAVIEFAAESL